MGKFTITVTKSPRGLDASPSDEETDSWDVKVIGMTAEEAKEWVTTNFGKEWTIRWNSGESYPCLLAKRRTEESASNLALSTITNLASHPEFLCKTLKNSIVIPGKERVFNLMSTAN